MPECGPVAGTNRSRKTQVEGKWGPGALGTRGTCSEHPSAWPGAQLCFVPDPHVIEKLRAFAFEPQDV